MKVSYGPERDMRFAVKRKRLPTEAAIIQGKNAARLMCVAGSGFPAPGGFAKPRCDTNRIALSFGSEQNCSLTAPSEAAFIFLF